MEDSYYSKDLIFCDKILYSQIKKALNAYNIDYKESNDLRTIYSFVRFQEDEQNALGFYVSWNISGGIEADTIWGKNFNLKGFSQDIQNIAMQFLHDVQLLPVRIDDSKVIRLATHSCSIFVTDDGDTLSLVFQKNAANERDFFEKVVADPEYAMKLQHLIMKHLEIHCNIFCHVVYRPLVLLLLGDIDIEKAKEIAGEKYRDIYNQFRMVC